jgi:Mu transposase-like protein
MNATRSNAITASSRAPLNKTNPFCDVSAFNGMLKAETCQQIHADALRRVTRNPQACAVPPGISVDGLREQALRYGQQVFLAHPEEIERLFKGVTLSVYREIESLYCSRLGRSYATVYRIQRAMALDAGVAPVEAEAVWAICMHLEELRTKRAAVTVERSSSTWRLVRFTLTDTAERTGANASGGTQHIAALVIDMDAARVLAFRADERGDEAELYSLALYDAFVLERRPHPTGAGGLLWRIPARLVVEGTLPEHCQLGCKILSIGIERAAYAMPLIDELREGWASEQQRRKITHERRALVFESLLNRAFGTSPLRAREEHWRAFGHLVGYSQDPAQLFPALRAFLPAYPAEIDKEGTVPFDGLHYANDLLSHWPGSRVTVRRSEHTEAVLWVYLEREILCQAMARELARRDGSYRTARVGR